MPPNNDMITIKNTQFESDISLAAIMNVMTKVKQVRMMTALVHYLNE